MAYTEVKAIYPEGNHRLVILSPPDDVGLSCATHIYCYPDMLSRLSLTGRT
jgi:hypothetical protein